MQSSSARDEQHDPREASLGHERTAELPERALEEFEQFYSKEFTNIARFLSYLGASYQDAQDAAQEAFVYYFQNSPQITDRQAWVRVVARRVLYRKNLREARSVAKESRPDNSSLFVYDEIPRLEKERVLGLLNSLPHTQRAVMAMHYDGTPIAEIAKVLEIAPATVRVHLHRARQHLKRLLADSWNGDSAEEPW
jgi:RNA polymerase sigma factor (sigma-70 family)